MTPERRLPPTPSDSPIARIAREEAEGLELDGHGEEVRELVHHDTWVERLDGGATGLDDGSGASVERKRRARQREVRGSTTGAKLQWRARPLPPPWPSARQASVADLLPRRQAHPWKRTLRVVSFLPSSRIHDEESGWSNISISLASDFPHNRFLEKQALYIIVLGTICHKQGLYVPPHVLIYF
jgi:hypothetical protein